MDEGSQEGLAMTPNRLVSSVSMKSSDVLSLVATHCMYHILIVGFRMTESIAGNIIAMN